MVAVWMDVWQKRAKSGRQPPAKAAPTLDVWETSAKSGVNRTHNWVGPLKTIINRTNHTGDLGDLGDLGYLVDLGDDLLQL